MEFLLLLVVTFIAPVLVEMGMKRGHATWLEPWLREAWFLLFCFLTIYVLRQETATVVVGIVHEHWEKQPAIGYIFAAFVGAAIFCGYWWFTGRFSRESLSTSSPTSNASSTAVVPPPKTEESHGTTDKSAIKVQHPQKTMGAAPKPESNEAELSPYLIYANGKIEIHNAGPQNFTLWGFGYGNAAVSEGNFQDPALVVPGTLFFLPTQTMEADILKEMPNGSNTHLACRVFITVHEQEKKTINCSLYIERNNDALTINTRVLGIADGWKTEALN